MNNLIPRKDENIRLIGRILANIEDSPTLGDETDFQVNYYGPEEGAAFCCTSLATTMCSLVIHDQAMVTELKVLQDDGEVETITLEDDYDGGTIVGMEGHLPIHRVGDILPEATDLEGYY